MEYNSFNTQPTFFQKLKSFDYILLTCILLLGLISAFSMYSTDGGQLLFHSKSHISKFLIFFTKILVCHFLILNSGIILLIYFILLFCFS